MCLDMAIYDGQGKVEKSFTCSFYIAKLQEMG
jgi:hypothetical protein